MKAPQAPPCKLHLRASALSYAKAGRPSHQLIVETAGKEVNYYMGYTHYWEFHAERLPAEAVALVSEILERAYAEHIVQLEHDDPQPPLVSDELIRFNGLGDDGHETFYLSVHDTYRTSDGRPFAFCKTALKPYDKVVMKVLIILKHYLGEKLKVTSDGGFDDEWSSVRQEMLDTYAIHTYVEEQLIAESHAA
jgi:hypothetical protein